MYIRSFLSVLIVTSSFILAIGQDAPEAKKEKEKEAAKAARAFAFSFDGDGSYLGVQTQEVNKENFSKFGLREVRGVAIEKVMENSPAAAAGLQTGDVIVRFNRDEVTSSRKLTRLISEVAPDHQVSLTVLRNGDEKDIKATLGKRQMAQFGNGNFSFPMPEIDKLQLEKELKNLPDLKNLKELKELHKGDGSMFLTVPPGAEGRNFMWKTGDRRQIGVSVYAVTKQLGERYGVDGGVMINDVRDDSPGAKAGLKAGDIIVEADGKIIKNQLDLIRAISDKKEGDVQLTIVRDRNRQTISVTPEAAKDGGFLFQTGDDDEGVMVPLPPGDFHPAMPSTPAAPMAGPGRMGHPATPRSTTAPMAPMPMIPGRVI